MGAFTELYLMWVDENEDHRIVGVLSKERFVYIDNNTPEMRSALNAGFNGFPAFDLKKIEHKNPLPVFIARCPPKERRDYGAYLKACGFDPDCSKVKNMTDLTFLGYTGARIPDDPFYLMPKF